MTIERERTQQSTRRLRPTATHDGCTEARLVFTSALEDAGVASDDASLIALTVGEMLSNAVRHGRPTSDGTIELAWTLAGNRVRVAVRDDGHQPHLSARLPSASADSGRGLWMIEQMALEWGVEVEDGTEVWAVLSCERTG